MKKFYSFLVAVFCVAISSFVACSSDDEGGSGNAPADYDNQPTVISGQIKVDESSIDYEGCKVTTVTDEADVVNGRFEVESYNNDKAKTFMLCNGDEVYMMNRSVVAKDGNIELNAESTTIAFITLHPALAPVSGNDDYNTLVQTIKNCSSYQVVYEEIEKAIKEKKNIYDTSNEPLMLAYSNLMEELFSDTPELDDEDFDDSLEDIIDGSDDETRAVYENSKVYPLYADIDRNVLTLKTVGLVPSYYGTITRGDGHVENISVESRDDYGVLDLIKKENRTNYGPAFKYTFSINGDYNFFLSRTNMAAQADFYLKIVNNILAALGLELENDVAQEISSMVVQELVELGAGIDAELSTFEPMAWVEIAFKAVVEKVKNGSFFGKNVSEKISNFAGRLLKGMDYYGKIKGSANAAMRLTYMLSSPKEISFCLCSYEKEVSTCTTADLKIIDGNDQTGYSEQKLLLPLKVQVLTYGDDGNGVSPTSYHRVKFEVVSGDGKLDDEYVSADHNGLASTYWTLGKTGEQKVKATVVDIITDKEISEPVYFDATFDSADITIRLDWNKHSGNTDIDLHVVDPYGERIAFYHMRSASGGYLDRDDVVGPGPEHIRWSNAPAGTYKIYVHYYPNGAEDRSVTSYKVSVTANGTKYRPVTGSIAYDQMVPVGQFTIGTSETRSINIVPDNDPDLIDTSLLPAKK